jgi:hypothetical protein
MLWLPMRLRFSTRFAFPRANVPQAVGARKANVRVRGSVSDRRAVFGQPSNDAINGLAKHCLIHNVQNGLCREFIRRRRPKHLLRSRTDRQPEIRFHEVLRNAIAIEVGKTEIILRLALFERAAARERPICSGVMSVSSRLAARFPCYAFC